MIQAVFDSMMEIGVTGLFIAMFFKGSTLPIPSLIFIVSYGYLLDPTPGEMVLLAFGMSLTFTLSSYLPYSIGYKLESKIQKKLGNKIIKAKEWFHRYGEWSVFFTRPFTIGMYISYVAGIGKVNPWKYAILTFLGILPWSFYILYISKIFKGNFGAISYYLRSYSLYVIIVLLLLFGLSLLYMKYRSKIFKTRIKDEGK